MRARLAAAVATAVLVFGACGTSATPAPASQAPATATPATAAPASQTPATAAPASQAASQAPSPTTASAAPATATPTSQASATAASTAGTAGPPVVLRMARLQSLTPIWHPVAAETDNQAMIFSLIFNTLVKNDTDSVTPLPDLADSWEATADGLNYTFHLHPGVKWHDGVPFTSKDVLFTINQAAQMASAYRGFPISSWKAIKGFADVEPGKATTVAGVTAPDDNTIKITLSAPDSEFLGNLAALPHSIMPEHILKDATKDTIEKVPFSTTSPIGTGPYKFVKNDADTLVELTVNPDYFKGAPVITQVFMLKLQPDVASAQLESGELDLVTNASQFDAPRLKENPSLDVIVPKPVDIHAVFINGTKWKDVRVMQAIYYAVDRRAINDQVLNGTGRVLNNPPGFNQDYPDINQYPYDPEKAKQLLKDANFPLDKPFVISYQSTQAVWTRVFPIVQKYLQDVGINAVLHPQDDTAWLNDITKNFDSWDLSIHTGGFEGLAPSISSIYYVCKGFFVDTIGYDGKVYCKVEELFTQARQEPDAAKREDLYHQIAKLLNDYPMREMWWSFPEIIVLNKKFHGMKPYAQTQRVLSNIETWTVDQ